MFLLTEISRAHSSGYENSSKKIFDTIEEVANYVHNVWYDGFCSDYEYPAEWDENDMGMPFPTKDEFTVEAIKNKFNKRRSLVLFGPYSQYHCLILNELLLEEMIK